MFYSLFLGKTFRNRYVDFEEKGVDYSEILCLSVSTLIMGFMPTKLIKGTESTLFQGQEDELEHS